MRSSFHERSEQITDGKEAAREDLCTLLTDESSNEARGENDRKHAAEDDQRGLLCGGASGPHRVGRGADGAGGKDPHHVDPHEKAGERKDERLQQEDIGKSAVCSDPDSQK